MRSFDSTLIVGVVFAALTIVVGGCTQSVGNTASTEAAPNVLSEQEQRSGWRLLWDGLSD